MLLSYVATYSRPCISKCRKGQNTIEVIATQGRVEIELYFEFLLETMNSQADRAKAAEDPFKLDRSSGRTSATLWIPSATSV